MGLAVTQDGSMGYKYINQCTWSYEAKVVYNSCCVVNYCVIGSIWISFDDVEDIKAKIAYAKEKKLLVTMCLMSLIMIQLGAFSHR